MSSNYIYLYFAFCYNLGITPYRFTVLKDDLYGIKTNLIRKVLCGTSHFFSLYLYGISFGHALEGMSTRTPVTYFRLFENIFSFIYKALFVKCIWLKQDAFLEIINFLQHQDSLKSHQKSEKKIESKWSLFCIFLAHATISVLRLKNPTAYPLSQIPYRKGTSNGMLYDWYRGLLEESGRIFFNLNLSSIDSYSFFEIITAAVTAVMLLWKFLMGTFADLGLFMVVLTLWSPVADFEKLLKSSSFQGSKIINRAKIKPISTPKLFNNACSNFVQNDPTFGKVIVQDYDTLRRLSNLINDAWGEVFIPFLGEGIFTYAINFKDILFLGELSHGIVVFSFYALFLIILQTASSICKKMQQMKEWLYDNEPYLELTCKQMAILLDSISKDSVSIAVSGVFVINYSLVGTLTSVLVTYFIVRIQYIDHH